MDQALYLYNIIDQNILNTMKKLFIIFLVIQTSWAFSQKIDVVDMSTTAQQEIKNTKELYFLHPDFEVTNIPYIAKYQFNPSDQTSYPIHKIFAAIQRLANKHGGNAFRLLDYKVDAAKWQITFLSISIYRINEADYQKNLHFIPTNKAFVFGNLYGKALRKIKINDQKTFVPPFSCVALQTLPGNYIKINIGGIFGQTQWVKSRVGKPSKFFTLSTFGMAPGLWANGAKGVKINTGRLYLMEPSYGYFLTLILPNNVMKV